MLRYQDLCLKGAADVSQFKAGVRIYSLVLLLFFILLSNIKNKPQKLKSCSIK